MAYATCNTENPLNADFGLNIVTLLIFIDLVDLFGLHSFATFERDQRQAQMTHHVEHSIEC